MHSKVRIEIASMMPTKRGITLAIDLCREDSKIVLPMRDAPYIFRTLFTPDIWL